MFRPKPIIVANLNDQPLIAGAIAGYILHPVTLMYMLLAPVLKLLRYMPLEFPVLGLWGDIAFYLLRMAVYVFLTLRFMPRVVPWLMGRNVPFFWATFLFWLGLLVVNYGVFHTVIPSGNGLWVELERFVRIVFFSLFGHLILMLIIQPQVMPELGRVPDLVPYFWPVSAIQRQVPHGGLISAELQGEVRALKAQNQYVLVMTDRGSHLVRMTLRNAIERLPTGSGEQIHRSWWVSNAELATARLDPDDAAFIAGPDRIYPVGKTYEADIMARRGMRRAT